MKMDIGGVSVITANPDIAEIDRKPVICDGYTVHSRIGVLAQQVDI